MVKNKFQYYFLSKYYYYQKQSQEIIAAIDDTVVFSGFVGQLPAIVNDQDFDFATF